MASNIPVQNYTGYQLLTGKTEPDSSQLTNSTTFYRPVWKVRKLTLLVKRTTSARCVGCSDGRSSVWTRFVVNRWKRKTKGGLLRRLYPSMPLPIAGIAAKRLPGARHGGIVEMKALRMRRRSLSLAPSFAAVDGPVLPCSNKWRALSRWYAGVADHR